MPAMVRYHPNLGMKFARHGDTISLTHLVFSDRSERESVSRKGMKMTLQMKTLFPIFLIITLVISACGKALPAALILPTPSTAAAEPQVHDLPAAATEIPTPTATPVEVLQEVTVTFLGNSGFFIEVGDKKVLIDALRSEMPTRVREQLTNAQPPFDDVDLILATHSHGDHFSSSLIRQYMQNNAEVVFISTTQAAQQMDETLGSSNGRVVAMDPAASNPVLEEVAGIQVEAIYWSHGTPPAGRKEDFNNAYIVTLNGVTLLHSGDIANPADILPYNLAEKGIDLTFFVYFFLENADNIDVIHQGIAAPYLFPIHYPQPGFDPVKTPKKILQHYPEAIFFNDELESWTMP
jgi:L-ascorbate metabolism protein UlaG (beta-lactamase superfamily)